VRSVDLHSDKESGRLYGYALFKSKSDAMWAIENLQNSLLRYRAITLHPEGEFIPTKENETPKLPNTNAQISSEIIEDSLKRFFLTKKK
jgi:hypothetical protein